MRYSQLTESMSFNAGHLEKRPDGNVWTGDVDSGDRYHPDVYKADYPYDADPKPNPNYKPELDLTLSNANMRDVFAELGYPTDLEEQSPFPIDEFIAKTTQWLQKHIDKRSKEEPTTVDKNPNGPTMIRGGKPEGYYNQAIMQMNSIARTGKQNGATHVWAS